MKEENIELSKETMEGISGGGPIKVRSCVVKELSLGGAIEKISGAFLEDSLRIWNTEMDFVWVE